jgi:superfamily II DNA or RNA helicase
MNNQDKGYLYEIQIRDYIINELKKPAYLWNDTPETILLQHNIIGSHNINRLRRIENKINPLQDTGIDIIQIENDDNCSLVQCKNGYKKGLRMEDLAGFNAWMNALDTLKGYVYYTDKLSINILSLPPNKRIEYVKKSFEQHNSQEINVLEEYKPYVYQQIAVSKFTEYFRDNNRGILSMPCGTGKTMTSYLISKKFKQIILLSPLKEFAKQNLNRYLEYGYENKTLLVSSDGCRDVKEIKQFIKSNKSFLISSTFCSVDCIRQIIDKCDDDLLIIIDEFHNLSKNNVIDETDDFYKILNSKKKIMYMSATPRVYELEDELEDTEHIFGEIFYKMSFNEAIEKKFITDYKIWLPSIHEDNSQLEKELSIYEIDGVMKGKCNFFFSCLLNNGSKKCIIYCQDTNEIKLMIEAMSKLNEFYCLDIGMNQITADNTEKQRKKILDDFRERDNIKLLFSVRILDECIDIPSCDSIFITYPTKSKIRTIQRMSRCMRINKSNSFKIGNIFIWCDEYDKILETLSGIKEYDIMFKDKIKVNSIGFFVKGEKKKNETDVGLVEKYIMGVKEFRIVGWEERLEMVKKYIDENGKRPSPHDKDKNIKILGSWLAHKQHDYIYKIHSMKIPSLYAIYSQFNKKYEKYFATNTEIWYDRLNKVKKYILTNNKIPVMNKLDSISTNLAIWMMKQKTNYTKKQHTMKYSNIYNEWTIFINEYEEYFKTDTEKWISSLNEVEKYISLNNKIPSHGSKNNKTRILGSFIQTQKINYKEIEQIMKKKEIYNLWTVFCNKYEKYFMTYNDQWIINLKASKDYIEKYNKLPSKFDKNEDIKILYIWISTQKDNYTHKKNNMKNEEIYNKWKEFISDIKYNKYFISNEELWDKNFRELKKYINDNNKTPSSRNIDTTIGRWFFYQKHNYKNKQNIMKNQNIYNKWTEFITDPMYSSYLN